MELQHVVGSGLDGARKEPALHGWARYQLGKK